MKTFSGGTYSSSNGEGCTLSPVTFCRLNYTYIVYSFVYVVSHLYCKLICYAYMVLCLLPTLRMEANYQNVSERRSVRNSTPSASEHSRPHTAMDKSSQYSTYTAMRL